MLHIFRRVRKYLIESSQMRKYMLYAIGEILLVMIGILLALQVNNWNQTRMNAKKEISYLKNLKIDLVRDTSALKSLILDKYDGKVDGLNYAKDYAFDQVIISDTVDFNIRASYGAVFSTRLGFLDRNTIDDLMSTGSLALISNDSLRNSITRFYALAEALTRSEERMRGEYVLFSNGLKPFDGNSGTLQQGDKNRFMAGMKTDEAISHINIELAYARAVKRYAEVISNSARGLLYFIDQELVKSN